MLQFCEFPDMNPPLPTLYFDICFSNQNITCLIFRTDSTKQIQIFQGSIRLTGDKQKCSKFSIQRIIQVICCFQVTPEQTTAQCLLILMFFPGPNILSKMGKVLVQYVSTNFIVYSFWQIFQTMFILFGKFSRHYVYSLP